MLASGPGGVVVTLTNDLTVRPIALSLWKARATLNLMVSKPEKQSYISLLTTHGHPTVAAAIKRANEKSQAQPQTQPQGSATAASAPVSETVSEGTPPLSASVG